jgi:hypothetical protein
LSVEELTIALVEIEGTLNARPLTDEYEEFEGEALTPSHLIQGRAISFIPQREGVKEESSCGERFRYITLKLQHFWKRWQSEYLTRLREFHRCKSGKTGKCVKEGDIVTVYMEKGRSEETGN